MAYVLVVYGVPARDTGFIRDKKFCYGLKQSNVDSHRSKDHVFSNTMNKLDETIPFLRLIF